MTEKNLMPEPMTLSDRDREVRHLTETATQEPARITVRDIAPDQLMAIPEGIARPECRYKWAARDILSQELAQHGGMWQIVTRSNHAHVSDRHFDLATGAILYSGVNVLVYTWKENVETMQKKTLADFDFRAKEAMQSMGKSYRLPDGKEVARLEVTEDFGKEISAQEVDPNAGYDFEAE